MIKFVYYNILHYICSKILTYINPNKQNYGKRIEISSCWRGV